MAALDKRYLLCVRVLDFAISEQSGSERRRTARCFQFALVQTEKMTQPWLMIASVIVSNIRNKQPHLSDVLSQKFPEVIEFLDSKGRFDVVLNWVFDTITTVSAWVRRHRPRQSKAL